MLTQEQKTKILSIQTAQRAHSRSFKNRDLYIRLDALQTLKDLIVENEERWLAALHTDLKKPAVESYASEIAVLLNEIDYSKKHLKKWMKPVEKSRLLLTGKEQTMTLQYPYGSVLVIAPWNYPLQLALMPVIGALAAGNGVVLKPSEFAPATSHLLATLIPEYFDSNTLYVIEGDAEVSKGLTALAWDFIFFTGGSATGKEIYQAAAKHLTPVVMELGGKNPCIVDETGFNQKTIEQIAWGKFLNAGQSCIAPDTVYVHASIYETFLVEMKKQIAAFYGEDPQHSSDYGRLIHEEHFEKVRAFLKDGTVYAGGVTSKEDRYISPTLMTEIAPDSPLAKEEIFGPILPVVPYTSMDDLLVALQQQSVPLVTYLFSEDEENKEKVAYDLESGSLSLNQVIVHAASPHVPFGGKGKSGLGRYHGEASFRAFSYEKTLFSKNGERSFSSQYPPYFKRALRALRVFRKKIF